MNRREFHLSALAAAVAIGMGSWTSAAMVRTRRGVELLVMVNERDGHNPRLVGEGHVIVACPALWTWSQHERTVPNWRLIFVPDMTLEEGQALTAEQRPPEFYLPAIRAFWLDPERWPADLQAWYRDDTRAEPMRTMSRAQLLQAKADEPLYERPNVIGLPPVIG